MRDFFRRLLLAVAGLALFPALTFAAVTINGTATANSFGSNIGSGVAATFTYTAPTGTVGLVMIEVEDGNGAPPTAFSYNGVAATLISGTFSLAADGPATSIWYLPSPPTGAADTVSITYAGSVTGGAVVTMVPLLGVSSTAPFQTITSANIANGVTTAASVTLPAATANDLIIGILTADDNPTTVTVNGGTQLTNNTSRGSLNSAASSLPGNGGTLGWTLTPAADWAMSAVAFLAPSSSGAALVGAASDTTSAAGNLLDQRPTTVFNPINLGTTPGDDTGDPAKVGMIKVKADLGGLVAGLTRRSTTTGVYGVTSPAGTTTVLNDTSQNWAVSQFAGQSLSILTGPLAGFVEPIASNTATSITVSSAFGSAIGSGVGYQIAETPLANADGYATSAGGTGPATLTDANKTWTQNQWEGFTAHFLSGAYAGQHLQIVSNNSNTLRFVESLNPGIAAGTAYAIGSVVPNLDPELALRSIQGPPTSDLLATPGYYSLEQTSSTVYTLFALTNASTAVSTVGARVRVINVGTASAVIAASSNTSGQLINNDSTLTNNEVTLAAPSGGVAQYAEFQCMLSDSGVTYWAVVTTGTIS